jgi:dTDP-4-dehydrorhamnose reductase
MRYLIFGAGWVGSRLHKLLPDSRLSKCRIDDLSDTANAIADLKPDVVINAAGRTGIPNVEACEVDEAARKATMLQNAWAAARLAGTCWERDVYLIHISSGCLWEFGADIKEDAIPYPPSWYGMTKAQGEASVLQRNPEACCLRIRMPIDTIPHPRNLITKLISYPILMEENNSITFLPELARWIARIAEVQPAGPLNAVSPGSLSPSRIIDCMNACGYPTEPKRLLTAQQFLEHRLISVRRSNVTLSTERLEGIVGAQPTAQELLPLYCRSYIGHH